MVMADGKEIAVRVALRARPLVPKEIRDGSQNCLRFIPNEPQVIVGQDKAFTFDYVFPGDAKQEALYETAISDRIDYLFKGYNVTVLAYGQTGSGKTYTMGTAYSSTLGDDEAKFGVIQRAVTDIFDGINDRSSKAEFLIKVSFLEVYNEDVFDLLQKNKDAALSIREDQDGIKIIGLTEQHVSSPAETFQALEQGTRSRTTASTSMNARSSRSHAIFTIILEQRALDNAGDITIAKFHLVDLAGSERAHKTGAFGDRFKEGVNINRGLLALGNVISSLCDNNSHIPYRDSKLTRLLQDSLGGNSHTVMIACVSPADSNFDETVNTLRYADRARKIKNKPIVNRDPQNAELMQLRQQVQMLQIQLLQGQSISTTVVNPEERKKNENNIKVLIERNRTLETENQRLARELQHSLDQTTVLCEKAMVAQMSKERILQRLDELQERTNQTIEALMNASGDDYHFQDQLQLLKEWQNKIIEIRRDQLEKNEEFELYSPSKKQPGMSPSEEPLDSPPCYEGENYSPCDVPGTDNFHMKSTLKQAAMSRELEELERALALKEEIASKMKESDSQMTVMRIQFESNLKQMEEEISNLQKEKEELLYALKAVHASANATKVSEQRRKRLQELEAQITDMKKQVQEKSRILKMKQDAERKVNQLQNEIQTMKTTRVKLLRQIKEEAERYRTLKMEKEREVASLKQKDRKRQYEMTKLQREFDKQKTVLKRKMEEASAANKRLNDALQTQKKVAERRAKEKQQSIQGIGSRVQQWLAQEIEVVLRSKEAQHHLEVLLDDRKMISEQLNQLQKSLESFEPPKKKKSRTSSSSSDDEYSLQKQETMTQIKSLKQEFELRNVQIADLQQKILDVDQEEKTKHRWDTVQSMVEAKCAMKWLFENVISAKLETILQESSNNQQIDTLEAEVKHLKSQVQTAHETNEKMAKHSRHLKKDYDEQIAKLVRENEDKTIYLLKQLNSSKNSNNSTLDEQSTLMERIKFQETEIERLSYLNDEIQKKDNEIRDLKEQLTLAHKGTKPVLLNKIGDLDSRKLNKTVVLKKKKETSMMEDFLNHDYSNDSFSENDENDPDYRATPMYRRKNNRKNNSDPLDYESSKTNKASTSASGCSCKISCGSRRCGCNKQKKVCTELCKCKKNNCCNRDSGDFSDSDMSPTDRPINTTFLTSGSPQSSRSKKILSELNGTYVEKSDSDEFVIVSPKPFLKSEDSISIINENGIKKPTVQDKSHRYFAPVLN